MSEELKPCPFCGCADIGTHLEWSMICTNCGAEGALEDTKEAAIAAWNRRATPPSPSTASSPVQLPRGARVNSNLVLSEEAPSTADPYAKNHTVQALRKQGFTDADLGLDGEVAPSTASEVGELRAKLAEWERLRDPAVLHANLLKGLPAKLEPRELLHIAGYSQPEVDAALAAKPATPGPVEVKVERGRVWIVKGNQSFMLAYEADTDEERSWYAEQLRSALSGITRGVKAGAAKGGNTQPSSAEVDVEAERKLFDAWYEKQPLPYVLAHMDPQQAAFNAWLAARRTQVPAQTGSGEEGKDAVHKAFKELVKKHTHRRPRIVGNDVEYRNEIDTYQIGRDVIDAAIAATQSEEQRG